MIVIVSAVVPPEHSGAGKRIFDFYKYLKEKTYTVKLVTHTKITDKDVILVPQSTWRFLGKINLVLTFFASLIKILLALVSVSPPKNAKSTVWLVSCGPLTFASAIVFRLFKFRIITQNTLVGSDDPEFKYPGDFWGLKYKMKKLQYSLSGCITSNSPALYNISKEHHPNCVMIPNPVELAHTIKQNNSNSSELRKNILFVGKLGFRKGIDIVFQTINQIHKYDQSIQFTLVGPNEEMDQFKSLFDDLPYLAKQKIYFTGYQNNTLPYFADADIFFMPSRREGFPTVFLEAMAHGLPVVAKKIDGITDFIFGEDYPTILDTEDPQAYADAIMQLIDEKDLYKTLAGKGKELVKRFEKEKIYQEYCKLIGLEYEQ